MLFKIVCFIFPACLLGQPLSKADQTKLYTQAITEYIKSVNETDKLIIDTLFVGPDEDIHEENLHDVELPKEILKTKIAKLKEEAGNRKAKYHKNFVFVNIIPAISKQHAQFLFVTFIVEQSPEKTLWLPKHNFIVDLNYDPQAKAYTFEKQRFEYNYSNKYTNKPK